MRTRKLYGNGPQVSEIGLGTWQLGTKWGEQFNDAEAEKVLEAAIENGITLIDTADCYNGGNSERAIGRFLRTHPGKFTVVTKCGRCLNPHVSEGYNSENISRFIDDSLERLQLDALDMVLLHCPPSDVFSRDDVFECLEGLKKQGKIKAFGVSVEKVQDALTAMKYGISAVEVVFNMFRLKPLEELFPKAKENGVGIIARVPLASGLLTGLYDENTRFGEKDHRTTNRNGERFDKGETFSGVDYNTGLKAVAELKKIFGTDDLIPYALKWILMHEEVSAVIPGASRAEQVSSNVRASGIPPLSAEQMTAVREVYDRYIRALVHDSW
ncbi:MAG: aldo/keto reductase [Treponema sp.]|nr:aldo/keto reductase [Treponema sp.]